MFEHAPVLLVVVPIVGATLPVLASLVTDRGGWPIATVTLGIHAVLAASLVATVLGGGPVSYEVGGFAAWYGIELVVDGLSAPVLAVVSGVGFGLLAYARHAGPRSNAFYSLYLLLIAGLSGMTVTGDVFNLYVFLEITGLAAYALVASGRRDSAAVAALKYLIIGTVGASLYLLGVGYLLVGTGTLNMGVLSGAIAEVGYDSTLVVAAFALIVGGLVVKVALYPVHTWQPDAYANAPATVSALISALVSTVAAYALARIVFSVFTVEFFQAVPLARTVLIVVASASVVAGALLAVSQRNVQRMLAYSSVSQFGLVIAGFAIATPTAVLGALVHLLGHAVMKGGLFAAAGVIERATGARTIEEYAGLSHRTPVAAGGFAALAFAMVGVPPAIGFVGKWYLVLGAARADHWLVVAVLLFSTLLTLGYFARLVESMYFTASASPTEDAPTGIGPRDEPVADGGDSTASTGMALVVVAAVVLALALVLAVPLLETALVDHTQFAFHTPP